MRLESHYGSLQRLMEEDRDLLGESIPVLPIPSLMPRSDKAPIQEGEKFSGNVFLGEAAVSLTLAASPHFPPEHKLSDLLQDAQLAFGKKPELLVDIAHDQPVAPHMIVWWRSAYGASDNAVDMFDLFAMKDDVRSNYLQGISEQVMRGFKSLSNFEGVPLIYGSWGFSEVDQRNQYGLGRGAPTMPFGHLHIAKARPSNERVTMLSELDLPPADTLKYRQPWNRLLNNELHNEIENIISGAISNQDIDIAKKVIFYDKIKDFDGHHLAQEQGYKINYSKYVPVSLALEDCTKIAGTTEKIYSNLASLHKVFYKNIADDQSQARYIEEVCQVGLDNSLSKVATDKLVDFALRIQPTTAQLREWLQQMSEESTLNDQSAQLLQEEIAKRKNRTQERYRRPLSLLVDDTHTDLNNNPKLTWPIHSSAIYCMDDIVFDNNTALTSGFHIFPAFVAESGAPEMMYGALLTRNMGETLSSSTPHRVNSVRDSQNTLL